MSGGMGRPWSGPTLADRSSAASAASGSPPSSSVRDDRAALTPHCWVVDAPEYPGRHAGLLLEWRRDGRRWLGLVAFVVAFEPERDRIRLIQQWLPAACLRPTDRP